MTDNNPIRLWLLGLMGDHDFTMPTAAFDELCAALAAQPSREGLGVPAGWKLVPVKLTQEMFDAASDAAFSVFRKQWEAVLDAAPPAPAPTAQDAGEIQKDTRQLESSNGAGLRPACSETPATPSPASAPAVAAGPDADALTAAWMAGVYEERSRWLTRPASPAPAHGAGGAEPFAWVDVEQWAAGCPMEDCFFRVEEDKPNEGDVLSPLYLAAPAPEHLKEVGAVYHDSLGHPIARLTSMCDADGNDLQPGARLYVAASQPRASATAHPPRPSGSVLTTLRVALERADFNYRATGLKDFEVQAAKDWVKAAIEEAK